MIFVNPMVYFILFFGWNEWFYCNQNILKDRKASYLPPDNRNKIGGYCQYQKNQNILPFIYYLARMWAVSFASLAVQKKRQIWEMGSYAF